MAAATSPSGFAAVVLSGGTGARLGGADKAALEVGGRTLLVHALEAVAGAEEIVVVGPTVGIVDPAAAAVRFVVEDPPGGGPAAGLLAGLAALAPGSPLVVVLAVDMPYVGPATVARLLDALADEGAAEGAGAVDGAFLVDEGGRRQLAGVLRPERLHPPDDRHGLPLHRLLDGLTLTPVPAVGRESVDVDTWADLEGC